MKACLPPDSREASTPARHRSPIGAKQNRAAVTSRTSQRYPSTMSTQPSAPRRSLLCLATLIAAVVSGCDARATSPSATPTEAPPLATPSPTATATPSPTPVPTSPPPPTSAPVSTTGWVGHRSRSGQLSFRYDPAWNLAECDPGVRYSWGFTSGNATTIFLGPQGFRECPLEDESPQIVLDSAPGTPAVNTPGPNPCGGSIGTWSSRVVVDGVTGLRQETRYSNANQCIGVPPVRDVSYVFGAHGRVYVFDYTFRQGDPRDLTGEFDQLVEGTMRFSAG